MQVDDVGRFKRLGRGVASKAAAILGVGKASVPSENALLSSIELVYRMAVNDG